jgi:hypothetical protein
VDRKNLALFGFWFAVGIGTIGWLASSPKWNVTEQASNALDNNPAELSIRPNDEPFSVPESGSSLFDKVFTVKNDAGVREYRIPYPFTRMLQKLQDASGGVAPRTTLFAMGRSLQRSAAIEGMKTVPNLDPFYRFPRMVVGFDQESRNQPDHLNLNMKGRLFIGMNEKAKLLEVISYNDEAGRYEYQVVRNYGDGQTPQVFYASRQLCLSCHQNQTPIFSRAPWSESNANPAMQEGLTRVMRATFGDGSDCADDPHVIFCHRDTDQGRSYVYSGAPLAVDQEVPYALDQSIRTVNYFHAYHKMWQRLCPDLECRRDLLKQIFVYKLTGQTGALLTPEVIAFNQKLQDRWNKEFPNGMKIPESAIPNRDPLLNHKDRGQGDNSLASGKPSGVKNDLQQVLANTDVPGEFEPLLPRSPSELWTSPFLNGNLSRLLIGYADFFTTSDVRMIDDFLINAPLGDEFYENVDAKCRWKRGSNVNRPDFTLTCSPVDGGKGLQFSTFVRIPPGQTELIGSARSIRFFPPSSSCDPSVLATVENQSLGRSCPQVDNVITRLRANADQSWQMYFQASTGLSVRMLDARRLVSIALPAINPGEAQDLVLTFRLAHDTGPLLAAHNRAFAAINDFRRFVDGPALNRQSVLTLLLNYLGKPNRDFAGLTKEMQTLKKQSEAPVDELGELPLKPSERAVALANRTCATCHFNRDGVPPNYLGAPGDGLNIVQRCQRVASCSGRMLFRLKMWDCDEADYAVKKTPMPPLSRMKALNVDLPTWKKTDRQQLFNALLAIYPQAELQQILVSEGVDAAKAQAFLTDLTKLSCPVGDSTMFEKLPRCDQSFPIGAALCQ